VRLALPRLDAGVEGVQRQLALQVPDDLCLARPLLVSGASMSNLTSIAASKKRSNKYLGMLWA
jgi:hypothetical protein